MLCSERNVRDECARGVGINTGDDQDGAGLGSQPKIGQPDASPCESERVEGVGSLPDVYDSGQILQIRIACNHLSLLIFGGGIHDRVGHG